MATYARYRVPDYSWITGGDDSLSHERMIDSGAFGEVHKVSFLRTAIDFDQLYDTKTSKVSF
jgi:hypothetical protein